VSLLVGMAQSVATLANYVESTAQRIFFALITGVLAGLIAYVTSPSQTMGLNKKNFDMPGKPQRGGAPHAGVKHPH
jgi:uncharacterized membrane protein